MKVIGRILWGALAIALAWTLIATFSQDAFTQRAPANILLWKTRPLPIYLFVVEAFVTGLAIGLVPAVYYFARLRIMRHKKDAAIARLTDRITALETARNRDAESVS